MEFIDALTSAATGGFAGLLGSVVSQIGSYFETRQKIKLKTMEYTQEIALHKLELEDKNAQRLSEERRQDTTVFGQTRVASYEHDTGYGEPYKWVVSVLRMIRPALTLGLLALVFYMYQTAPSVLVTQQVLFMTSAALAWWFGDRGGFRGNNKK